MRRPGCTGASRVNTSAPDPYSIGSMCYSSTAKRLFLGRTLRNSSTINLYDPLGRVRLRLEVDKDGIPKIEFFDEQGESIKRLSVE